jgi:hypothetical protein
VAPPNDLFSGILEGINPQGFVNDLISKRSLDKDARAQLSRIDTLKQQILDAGLSPNVTEPRESLFLKTLNVIDKPKQVVLGIADSVFGRQDIGEIGLLGAAERGLDERINMFDVLRREGVESPVARAILGFGGEILLDPLTLLTGPAKGAAFAGGKALTKVGKARKTELLGKLNPKILETGPAGEVIEKIGFNPHIDNLVDDTFRAADDFRDVTKRFENATSPAVKEELAARMTDIQQRLKPLTDIEDFELDQIGDLFKNPSVRLETSLPFLGILQGKKATPIPEGAGAIRKALALADNVFRPGTISTKELDLSKVGEGLSSLAQNTGVSSALKNIGVAGTKSLKALEDTLKAVETVPFVGAPVTVGKAAAGTVKRGAELAANGFKNIFLQKMVIGKKANDARLAFVAERAGSQRVASDEIMKLYDDVLMDEAKRPLLSEALVEIDALAFNSLEKLSKSSEFKGAQDELLDAINSAMRGEEVDVTSLQSIAGLEDEFRENLNIFMNELDRPQEVKDLVQRSLGYFDAIRKEEVKHGIKTGFLASYVPHIYENLARVGKRGIPGDPDFLKTRKFNTLSEAFEARGLVPNLDLSTAAQWRRTKGLQAIAQQKYFHRTVLEHGMPLERYKKLVQAAEIGDQEAIELLKREKLPQPTYLTDAELAKGSALLAKQAKTQAEILNFKAGKIQNSENVASAINNVRGEGFAAALHDGSSSQAINNSIADMGETVRREAYKIGERPRDSLHPEAIFNEVAAVTKDLDGKEFVLPVPIAKGFDETVQARDFIKMAFGESELGRAMINSSDAAMDFLKKTVTLPFPAYWVRNLVGDSFFRLADGGLNAIRPGIYAETAGLLEKGSAGRAVTLDNGQVLDAPTFQRILRENGIQFANDDFLEVMKDTGNLNIQKLIQKERGILKTAKSGQVGATLQVTADKLRDRFENFFRANHLLHRLKTGDTVRDGVRNTNQALIDYRDLSPVEQSLFRRMFFFYGWMSKATKKTITSLFTSPGDLQVQLKAARGTAEFFADPNAAPTIDEFEQRNLNSMTALEQVAFPIGRDKEGKPITGRGFGLPLNTVLENFSVFAPRELSLSELTEVAQDSTTRTLQKLSAGTNPALKVAAEQLTGRNLFFDKPLSSKFLRRLPSFESAAKKLAGIGFDAIPPEVAKTLDAPTKALLKAVPDGKGGLIADPGRYYLLINVIPGIARANATLRNAFDADIPIAQSVLTSVSGVRVEKQDFERSLAFEQEKALRDIIVNRNVREILDAKKAKAGLIQ